MAPLYKQVVHTVREVQFTHGATHCTQLAEELSKNPGLQAHPGVVPLFIRSEHDVQVVAAILHSLHL